MSVIFPYKTKKFLFYIFPDLIPVLLRFLMRRLFLSPQCAALYHHQFNWKRDKKASRIFGHRTFKRYKAQIQLGVWEALQALKCVQANALMVWQRAKSQKLCKF